MRSTTMGIVCFAVLCITLSLGLWPFHAPLNQVSWLRNANGLLLRRYATLSTAAPLESPPSSSQAGAAIEVWLKPRRIWDSGTFLAIYDPTAQRVFSLVQSQLDLKLYRAGPARKTILYVENVFHKNFQNRTVFLTITSDGSRTTVYVNGTAVRSSQAFPFSGATLTGRLILGTAPRQNDDWGGQLFGVAIYRRGLTAPEVLRHYRSWTQRGKPEIAVGESNSALYLFDERTGSVVHNRTGPGPDLEIPKRYEVIGQLFLQPVWDEFEISRNYGGAAVKNIVGLIPFGFCFYAWFLALRMKRAALLSVLSGALVSLTIEVLQTFLPTRDSGMTDLVTNTFGTWVGVELYRRITPLVNRLLPELYLPNPPK